MLEIKRRKRKRNEIYIFNLNFNNKVILHIRITFAK